MSKFKPHAPTIKQLHDFASAESLKLIPVMCFIMILTVKYLGHVFGFNKNKPISSKVVAIHKIPSPTTKIELMMFIRSVNLLSKLIEKFRVNIEPLFDLLHDTVKFYRIIEKETPFPQIKTSFTKDVNLVLPDTSRFLFFITEDTSLNGLGCVLFHKNYKVKL